MEEPKIERQVPQEQIPSIWDLLYGVLASPAKTLRQISERHPLGWAILIVILISPLGAITLEQPEFLKLGRGSLILLYMSLSAIMWPIWAGLMHLMARLLRGQGDYLGLLCALGFAGLPRIFVAPLALLGRLLGIFGTLLELLGNLALGVWMLVLGVLAVRETHGLSTGRAVAAFLIPSAVIGIIIGIIAVSLILPEMLKEVEP